jgi:dinuclear metal center YbgI/SA1388 family protein
MNTAREKRPPKAGSGKTAVNAAKLGAWFEQTLQASRFKDYCPNGLQAEGTRPIRHLVCGVTASLTLLKQARADEADAVLVHHGWFWRGEDPRLIGPRAARVRELVASGMHLFAFHLPLDVHPELGNNAQLGRRLGWAADGRCGDEGLINWHDLPKALSGDSLGRHLRRQLGHEPVIVGSLERSIARIAWCTGAAQDMIVEAAAAGADAFVSGEISERTTHLARELGIIYAAAGHHATERFGVQALATRAAAELGITQRFIDDPNPV